LGGVHPLERSFLVFLVAHGEGPIQISPRFSLFLALISISMQENTLRKSPGSTLGGLPSSDAIRFQGRGGTNPE
jgi:hypothetical protein